MKTVAKRQIPTLKNMKQIYDHYTKEDHVVWEILYDRQIKNVMSCAAKDYIKSLELVGFERDQIPNFEEVNTRLAKLTSWELVAVDGIVDDALFFQLLADKKFPATTWLRTMEELDYLEEPDMFHDVFAHVPLLANQSFVDFLKQVSKVALNHIDDKWMIHLISRIYWFTVEFGLIQEDDEVKIYGAGILSSAGETLYSLSDEPKHHHYDVEKILNTSYRKDQMQQEYFIIQSFTELFQSVGTVVENLLEPETSN